MLLLRRAEESEKLSAGLVYCKPIARSCAMARDGSELACRLARDAEVVSRHYQSNGGARTATMPRSRHNVVVREGGSSISPRHYGDVDGGAQLGADRKHLVDVAGEELVEGRVVAYRGPVDCG